MKKRFAYILFFIATVIWGFAFIAQKSATAIPPFVVGAIRSLLATLFLFALIPLMDKISKNGRKLISKNKILDFTKTELIGGTVIGVIITVATTFQQYGITNTEVGKASFITGLYVVIVPIIATFLGKRPGILSSISIPIAIVGFYFLCIEPGSSLNPADLLVLVCAVIFAIHIISVDHFSKKCDGVRMSFIQFLVSFVLNSLAAIILKEPFDTEIIASAWLSLVFLGIMSSGIAYTLQILGQKAADPTISSIILSMESVIGVVGGALFFNEHMNNRQVFGCIVVLCAVIMAQLDIDAIKKIIKKEKPSNE